MKVLIIRLSSLGDIVQALECASTIKGTYPQSELHWMVKEEFSSILRCNKEIDHSVEFEKKSGLLGFLRLCFQLRKENYTHVYDAHNNLRSFLASSILRLRFRKRPRYLRRSKQRWKRFLLFQCRKNFFPKPYKATVSFLEPLSSWNLSKEILGNPRVSFERSPKIEEHKDYIQGAIAIVPSAAWELKRWPLSHWKELIRLLEFYRFSVLGGSQDHFCEALVEMAPERIRNFSGQLSWEESFQVLSLSPLVISGDTGCLHMADYLNRPTIALMGPTAFGYPARPNSQFLEIPLACKPCSKDGNTKCRHPKYKYCLDQIRPELLSQRVRELYPQ